MYQKTTLGNKLRIVTGHMPHMRSVSVSIFVGSGSRYEAANISGMSHFVEHILFKGTQRMPDTRAISEAIEGVGGVLNGGTDKELTVYWAKVARPHFELAFNVLADMVRNSRFDPADVEKERQVIIEEINMSMDSPQQRVGMIIDESIWPDHPLGRDIAGTRETVSSFTRDQIIGYHSSSYHPGSLVIAVAGDIEHSEVVELADKVFGDWAPGDTGLWEPFSDNQLEPRFLKEHRDTEQIHLCLSVRGVSSSDPDRHALDMVNVILGAGMSSRLFLELREERGMVYDINSHVSHFFDSGELTVSAGIDPANLESALKVILEELAKLKSERVSAEELQKAKEMAKGRMLLGMEDSRAVASWIGSQELLKGEIKTIDDMVKLIDAVTSEDIQKVAQKLFCAKGLNLAVVGPSPDDDRIRSLLVL